MRQELFFGWTDGETSCLCVGILEREVRESWKALIEAFVDVRRRQDGEARNIVCLETKNSGEDAEHILIKAKEFVARIAEFVG